MTGDAVNVGDRAAPAAHEVLVVVADPGLVAGRAPGGPIRRSSPAVVSAFSASYTAWRVT